MAGFLSPELLSFAPDADRVSQLFPPFLKIPCLSSPWYSGTSTRAQPSFLPGHTWSRLPLGTLHHDRHSFHQIVNQPAAPSRLSHPKFVSLAATKEGEAEPIRHAQAVRAVLPDASWGGLVAVWLRGRIRWWRPRGAERRGRLDNELPTDSCETKALRQ